MRKAMRTLDRIREAIENGESVDWKREADLLALDMVIEGDKFVEDMELDFDSTWEEADRVEGTP